MKKIASALIISLLLVITTLNSTVCAAALNTDSNETNNPSGSSLLCCDYTPTANVASYQTYTEDIPSMSLHTKYDGVTGKVTVTVNLDRDSMLGAGDFVLKFDTAYLTYISAQKEFSPSFFLINDKYIPDGLLKFSIISLTDITDAQTVLTVTFETNHTCSENILDFEISGSVLTDSLTNPVMLNFKGANVTIPAKHIEGAVVTENSLSASCTTDGRFDTVVYCTVCNVELSRKTTTVSATGHKSTVTLIENSVPATCATDGSYDSVVYCTVCNLEISRETTTIPAKGHKHTVTVIENSISATCATDGSYDSVVYCTVCNKEVSRETTIIPAKGHKNTVTVIENSVSATCVTDGSYDSVVYCTVCNAEISRKTTISSATGHKSTVKVIENSIFETCTTDGIYDSVIYCTVCNKEVSRETITVPAPGHTPGVTLTFNSVPATCTTDGSYDEIIYCALCSSEISETTHIVPAIGHSYCEEATAPTCTAQGYTTYTCKCGYSYVGSYVDANGHTDGAAVRENEVNSTCTSDGSYDSVTYCTVCNEETSRSETVIPSNGHSFSTETKAPTCTEKGHTNYTCSCGYSYMVDENALDHDFSPEWTVDIEATTETLGQKSRHCTRCDEKTDIIEISKLVEIIDTSKKFEDVVESWAKAGIDYVVSYGYMNGTGNGSTFSPTGTMSRSMIVTVLYRIAGQPSHRDNNPFNDIETGWFYDAVLWAYENGIVTGTSATTFAPNGDVTREQMATFLYRFAKYMKYDVSKSADLTEFPDESNVGNWAYDALAWANAEGLITGAKGNDGVTKLNPQGAATREQVATILMRFCQAY